MPLRLALGPRRLLSSLAWTLLAGLLQTAPATASPPSAEAPDAVDGTRLRPPRGRVLTGHIRRDAATVAAIGATRDRRVAVGSGAALDLRMVVTKSRFRLDLYEGDRLLKVYPVALGADPLARKVREGDNRTPEGDYLTVPHHASPGFGGCFYVCYPGLGDARRARAAGLLGDDGWRSILDALRVAEPPPTATALGGMILVHGTRDRAEAPLTDSNWTQGCVAMENRDLLELLGAFLPEDRPVLSIRP